MIRKEMELRKPDKVRVQYTGSPLLVKLIKENIKKIRKDVNATSIVEASSPHAKPFEIEEETANIAVEKV